jgi:hypothetical protein
MGTGAATAPKEMRGPYCFNPMRGIDLLPHLQEFHVDRNDFDPGPVVKLLNEWYQWWLDTPNAPAKMPSALHVRTAMVLMTLGYEVAPDPIMELPPDTTWVETVEITDFKA